MKRSNEQRKFVDKINKRLKTLATKFDINPEEVIDSLNLDGVYTTKAGRLAIDPSFWSNDLAKRLDSIISTATTARAEALDRLKNFIGPIHERDIKREVQAKYEVEDAWEDIREKYYEIEDMLAQVDSDIISKLADFGRDFNAEEVSYSDLLNFKDEILKELEHPFD